MYVNQECQACHCVADIGYVGLGSDFWEYFEPIREYMPSTCSEHVQSAVARLDTIFQSGNETRIKEIKKSFGLSDLTSSIDFLGARTYGSIFSYLLD